MSETAKEFKTWVEAFIDFQAHIPPIGKTATANTGKFSYSYAQLDEILEIIRKPLTSHGLALTWRMNVDAEHHVETLSLSLLWRDTAVMTSMCLLNPSQPPQQRGSEQTYLRRYLLLGLLGIQPTNEDDDGQAAQALAESRARSSLEPADTEFLAQIDKITDIGQLEHLWRVTRNKEEKDYIAARGTQLRAQQGAQS